MSRHARACTIMFGSLPFSAAYEILIFAGAHATNGAASPPAWMIMSGAFPQVVAILLLVAILLSEPPKDRQETAHLIRQRRPLPQPARKELTR